MIFVVLVRALRRFATENFNQVAASLAFTTLLSLVPMAALLLAIATAFPAYATFVNQLDAMLVTHLLPTGAAGQISGKIFQFSRRAAEVSWAGVVMLGTTAFLLLHTIERALNNVWRVSCPRPLWQRLILYILVIAVWPLLIGGVLAALSYAVTTSLGLVGDIPWLESMLLKLFSLSVLVLFFALLYRSVPSAPVRWRHAVIGGLFTACGFVILQKCFGLYLSYFPSYKAIYGAFAVVPLFLLWVYMSWALVLIGALVSEILSEFSERFPLHGAQTGKFQERRQKIGTARWVRR